MYIYPSLPPPLPLSPPPSLSQTHVALHPALTSYLFFKRATTNPHGRQTLDVWPGISPRIESEFDSRPSIPH